MIQCGVEDRNGPDPPSDFYQEDWPFATTATAVAKDGFLSCFSFVLMILPLIAQESIRPSLAGEQIERLQKPTIDRSRVLGCDQTG